MNEKTYQSYDSAGNKYGINTITWSGTRKVADLPSVCMHSEHNPPSMMVYESGVYEHKCPNCGHIQTFTVTNPIM